MLDRYERHVNRKMRRRTAYIYICILLGMFIIVGRLLFVYIINGDRYSKAALENKQLVDTTIPYKRGDILDRNGVVLAKSEVAFNIILDCVELSDELKREKENTKNFDENSNILTKTFDYLSSKYGILKSELEKIYKENIDSRYYILKKDLSNSDVSELREKIKSDESFTKYGIWLESKYKRVYPFNDLAGNVIGFINNVGDPIVGIESQYNDQLTGKNGRDYQYFDQNLGIVRNKIEPVDGNDIVLTIDVGIQKLITDKIKEYYQKENPKNMAILVTDPSTGEVLGMASTPFFDLNNPSDSKDIKLEDVIEKKEDGTEVVKKQLWQDLTDVERSEILNKRWQNYIVSNAYEPGSTFKPITVSAGLELNKFNIDTTFLCDGGEQIYDYYIYCYNHDGHGLITAAQAIQYSCNDALMQMVDKIGKEDFFKYQRLFNFGYKTNIDLPDEVGDESLLQKLENMGPVDLATNSFGQNFSVNMLQIACADGAIGNNGKYYKPYICSEIKDTTGITIKKNEPQFIKQVISKDTAYKVKMAMRMVVEDTSIKDWGVIEGYENQLFGKTGTAEKLPRSDGKYISSFIEMGPFDNPKVLVYVVIDEGPSIATTHASQISSELLRELLPMLNIQKN